MYDKLVAKADNIYTCGLFSKAKYYTDKSGLEEKISDGDS